MSAPTTVGSPPTQTSAPSAVVSVALAGYFSDIDAATTRVYSITGLPVGTGLSISSSTGAITGTPNSNDLAASFTATVRCADASNAAVYKEIDFDFVVSTAPTAAQNYYIAPSTGDDVDAGDVSNPWERLTRANTVAAHASGHTDIWLSADDHLAMYDPQNPGTDSTHQIRLRADGTGPARIIGSGLYWASITVDWISVLRESNGTDYLVCDGEVEYGTSGGQIAKGDAPEVVAGIDRGMWIDASNITIDMDFTRTAGWNGIDCGPNCDNIRISVNYSQHGTPYYPDGDDFGDCLWVSRSCTGTIILDGGSDGRSWDLGGHTLMNVQGGVDCSMWGHSFSNSWADVATFSGGANPDGNRCIVVTRNARHWHCFSFVCQRNGVAQDSQSTYQEIVKLEGRDNCYDQFVLRNSVHEAVHTQLGDWSSYCQGLRISHGVFENCAGPMWNVRDYGAGVAAMGDLEMVNCIAIEPVTNTRPGWENHLLHAVLNSGTWDSQIVRFAGITVQAASRDDTDFMVYVTGAGGPGEITVQDALIDEPTVFFDIDIVTDANLDSRPAASAQADVTALETEYEIDSGDSTSLGQGVPLTTVASTGSGTSMLVTDHRWFHNPAHGLPQFGYFAPGHFVYNEDGPWTEEITAVNRSTGALTLAVSQSWTAGDRLHRQANPNRGLNH